MLVTKKTFFDKHDSLKRLEDTEDAQQQKVLSKKIAKISAHINRLETNLKACKRGKSGRIKHSSLKRQKEIFENLLNNLQKQLDKINLMSDFFFVEEDPIAKSKSLFQKVRFFLFG